MRLTEKQADRMGVASKIIPFGHSQEFSFTWPPSQNNLYANNPRTGGRFMVKRGKDYYQEVSRKLQEANFKSYGAARLKVEIMCHEPAAAERIRDIQNADKTVLDAMGAAGLYFDDSQIDDIRIRRGPVSELKKGEIVVMIEPITEGE